MQSSTYRLVDASRDVDSFGDVHRDVRMQVILCLVSAGNADGHSEKKLVEETEPTKDLNEAVSTEWIRPRFMRFGSFEVAMSSSVESEVIIEDLPHSIDLPCIHLQSR